MNRLLSVNQPTDLGEGEVWVVVRQGQMPLLTLSIKPEIVETRAQTKAMAFVSTTQTQPDKARVQGNVTEYPSPSRPLHQLRIIEQRNGDSIIYRYELDSPILGLLNSFESKPIRGDREQYVRRLYEEIEARYVSNPDDAEAFTEELRAFGGSLFDQLFPNELKALLWEYHPNIESIMVLSSEPFIPWELVHLKQPGQSFLPEETKFLGQMGLVRWLYESGGFPPQIIQIRKGYTNFVIPHYPINKYRLRHAETECEFLYEKFWARRIPPKPSSIRVALQGSRFDLLHFAGHGTAEQDNIGNAKLLLEGRIEGDKYVKDYLSATTVSQFAKLDHRPMVVLNACQIGREGYSLTGIGGFAEAFLRGGAGAFVGPLWSVGDGPAKIFTETLYEKLLEEQTLSEATSEARDAAKKAGNATWLAYAVYGHPDMKINLVE